MLETSPAVDALGYVSVDLAAKAAGISRNDMQRIAAAFAKGRAEPWLGAVLDVRTEKVVGRKLRDIHISSLPTTMRDALMTNRFRFLLAAEQAEAGAELGPPDFLLLHRAAHSGFAEVAFFEGSIAEMCAGSHLLRTSRERFDLTMDNFYGWGFRDDALPGVPADYREFLDAYRRDLGMSDRYYAAVLMELGGVDRPERLEGPGFVKITSFLMQHGVPWALPLRDCMDRETIGVLHEACHQLGISYGDHMMIVTSVGGGAIRSRDLDASSWFRVRASHLKAGYGRRPPPPWVPGERGFISQPQVNLIWRLWCDQGGDAGDASAAALDRWLGYGGGLATLTASGAGRLIDELLAPVLCRRLPAAPGEA